MGYVGEFLIHINHSINAGPFIFYGYILSPLSKRAHKRGSTIKLFYFTVNFKLTSFFSPQMDFILSLWGFRGKTKGLFLSLSI